MDRFHAGTFGMEISGTVRDGVVIPEERVPLPEGAVVRVVLADGETEAADAKVNLTFASGRTRVKFPLVESTNPGSVHLTNKRIAGISDEDDVARHQRLAGPDA